MARKGADLWNSFKNWKFLTLPQCSRCWERHMYLFERKCLNTHSKYLTQGITSTSYFSGAIKSLPHSARTNIVFFCRRTAFKTCLNVKHTHIKYLWTRGQENEHMPEVDVGSKWLQEHMQRARMPVTNDPDVSSAELRKSCDFQSNHIINTKATVK